jgi:hypothetical protein
MRTTGLFVVMVVTGGLGCFSTARYDDAHTQRVAIINARYEAESAQEARRESELVSALEADEALLIPLRLGGLSGPVSRVGDRPDIVECRTQCDRPSADPSVDGIHASGETRTQCLHDICDPAYTDALTRTYVEADVRWVGGQLAAREHADLESLMAFSHDRVVSRRIEDDRRRLAEAQAQARHHLAQVRQAEIAASARRRDLEIASARATHGAGVQAAAFAAKDVGSLSADQPSVCAAGDARLNRIIGCRLELPLPELAPEPQLEHPPGPER